MRACLIIAAGLLLGCASPGGRAETPALVQTRHRPPENKDVFEVLLASSSIVLKDASCLNAGRGDDDTTVGQFLSGFLADLNDPKAQNYIEVTRADAPTQWEVTVMVRQQDEYDLWSAGIAFAISKNSGSVLPESFRCIVAG